MLCIENLEVTLLFCSACGNNVGVGEKFCSVCGKELSAPAPAPGTTPQAGMAAPGFSPTTMPAETSGKAIASLICGLFIFAFPLSILAIIFGHLSLSEIRKSGGRLQGRGLAIAGLVLGYGGLAAIPLILILAAIAIPSLLNARIAANEASAVSSVRTLIAAEAGYASSHPQAGYTCTLADLSADNLIDTKLASGQKNGYVFELHGFSASADSVANVKYRVSAYPLASNTSGRRTFCADESGAVKAIQKGSQQDCMESSTALP
jgi:type IV pilus assembly protein PilA